MLPLSPAATLADIQHYVAEMETERGFAGRGVVDQCLLLGEEVGELFKAVRKSEHLPVGSTSIVGTVDEELADILIFVCAVANRYGIDLTEALRRKEEHNERRVWS
ncbi:MazG nucleotide pyrophosphohydrolase domain-containing protein [Actinoplanes sp. G11-F43]|uniref:MazG nucleotide pyrophosphohydrolase domain-containing protein n=1 Tax=Actinoplanes sp. G11-F43 TaxID=3424130 RepID=UPI003D330850